MSLQTRLEALVQAIGADVKTMLSKAGGVLTGPLSFTVQDDPPAPSTGLLSLYARRVSGRNMLKIIGPSGVSNVMQSALFGNSIAMTLTATGASMSSFGHSNAVVGTVSHPAKTQATGFMANVAIAATANTGGGVGNALVLWQRGAMGQGPACGFFKSSRVYFPDTSYNGGATGTGSRLFSGLTAGTVGTVVANDIVVNNTCGFLRRHTQAGAQDTNWQFVTKGVGGQTVVDTGMPFWPQTIYDTYVYCTPSGNTIYWRIDNITDGMSAEGSVTLTLPDAAASMRAVLAVYTVDAVVRNVRLNRIYCESDV